MPQQSHMKWCRQGQVNCFLLCAVVAKQTRRLGRLMPERRIPELITLAMSNCTDYELELDVDACVPDVVRKEAMQIGRLTRRPEPAVASNPGRQEGGQLVDATPAIRIDAAQEVEPADPASLANEGVAGAHLSAVSRVDLPDFHSLLLNVQRKRSMSNSNGVDPIRVKQLRAIAENLCALAKRHRENHNYVVAHALYGRALSVAEEIHTPEKEENVLMTRIRTDQQAVFELLRAGETVEKAPLEKAQNVGR